MALTSGFRSRLVWPAAAGLLLAAIAWLWLRPAPIDRETVYRIGYGNDEPLHFAGSDGQPAGLAVELVQEAARRAGIRLEWVHGRGFNQAAMDLWVLQTLRRDRRQTHHLSAPFLQTESCFLVRADSPIRTLADLAAARVSYADYAALRDTLTVLLPDFVRVPTPDSREAVRRLTAGEADAAFVDQYAVTTLLLGGGGHPAFRILPNRAPQRQLGISARSDRAAVADELRRAMQPMVEDGTVLRILERWAFFPSLSTDVIGELAGEQRRQRLLVAWIVGLSVLLAGTVWLAVVLLRRTREVRRTETLLRKIADRVPGLVCQIRLGPDGRVSLPFASDAIRQIYGLVPEAVRQDAQPIFDLIDPADAPHVAASIRESARTLAPLQCEYRIRLPDGEERWIHGNALPQREPDGATLWHGFITDITQRRRADEALEALERRVQETQKLESLGVLAGGIAHDFNNLLTGILGNATLAGMDLPPGAPAHEPLETIRRSSHRAADLCRQMLAYSGRGRFVIRTLSLNALVEDTTQLLQLSIGKHAVLQFRLGSDLPPIAADATQLRQVIMNLVINASEAIGERGGVIGLGTGLMKVDRDYLVGTVLAPEIPQGDYVYLEVSDNGCGMDAATRARIFDPFFTTKFTGRGLGLAAVLGIVRGHKGALKLYSEPGQGTTFKVLFPRAAGAIESDGAAGQTGPVWRGWGTVLVVDDEETVRTTATQLLQRLGFDVVAAGDGQEGVDLFAREPDRFRAVLMDLTMPRLDGRKAFAEMRRIRPGVRVVLMSGFNEEETVAHFLGKGLAGFVQKPFNFETLAENLQRALAEPAA